MKNYPENKARNSPVFDTRKRTPANWIRKIELRLSDGNYIPAAVSGKIYTTPVMNNTAGLLITMDKLAQYKSFFINIIFGETF